jgi:signal transduction histidine kinase
MMSLIEDVLDMSRLEFNNFELNLSWFCVDHIIKEVFDMMQYQAK